MSAATTTARMLTTPFRKLRVDSAPGHRVYVEDLDDRDTLSDQLYYCPAARPHWLGFGLHLRAGGEDVFISPGGRIVTRVGLSATEDNVFTLDPAIDRIALLNAEAARSRGCLYGTGAVVDGATPSFIYGTARDTYAVPLP